MGLKVTDNIQKEDSQEDSVTPLKVLETGIVNPLQEFEDWHESFIDLFDKNPALEES
tara:strand:+ start:386 stop:556 length:171 start_codon:yes stop_codon:yes gene_type:complete